MAKKAYEYFMSHKSYSPPLKCIYRALGTLLKCPSRFSILVDISHDYHMTYSLIPFYSSISIVYTSLALFTYGFKIAYNSVIVTIPFELSLPDKLI